MAGNYSTGDIYDEALKRRAGQRAEADRASKAAYKKVSDQVGADYDALNNEAYVNRALADRAFGTAGENFATLRQRRESNLRNTLGKNERQHKNFSDSVDLALKSYETRRAADDTANALRYGAAQDAALVSQGNFDSELNLKQQRLELNQQDSLYSRANALLGSGMIGNAEYKALTGIDVKSPPRRKVKADTRAIIINAGEQAPAQRTDGYTVRTVYDPKTAKVTYFEVRNDVVKDMDQNRVSLQDSSGQVKSDIQIYAEIHYDGYSNASPEEQLTILQENEKDITKFFGDNHYTLLASYLESFGNICDLGLPELKPVEDILRNFNDYVADNENGVQGVFDMYNQACQDVANGIAEEYSAASDWNIVKAICPEIAEQYEYTGSYDDIKRERLGISPASFTPEAFAAALQEAWREEAPYGMNDMQSIARSNMLQEMGIDLSELTVTDILCLSVYIDSVAELSLLNTDREETEEYAKKKNYYPDMLEYGEQLYKCYITIKEAKSLPNPIRATVILNSGEMSRRPDIVPALLTPSTEEIAMAIIKWNAMTLEEQYETAYKMLEYSYAMRLSQNAEQTGLTDEEKEQQIKQGLITPYLEDTFTKEAEETEEVVEDHENIQKTWLERVLGKSDAQEVIDLVLDIADSYKNSGSLTMFSMSPLDDSEANIEKAFTETRINEVINFVLFTNWENVENNLLYGRRVGASGESTMNFDQALDEMSGFESIGQVYPFLSENERNTLLYYYGKGNTESLIEYIKIIEPILKDRRTDYYHRLDEHDYEQLEQFVQQEGLEGEIKAAVLSTVYSFCSAPAYFETLLAVTEGDDVDIASPAQTIARRASNYAEIATSSTSNVFAKWAVQAAINMVSNLPYYFLGPAGAVMMGLNAAGQTAAQMNYEGYSAWGSFAYSTAVGLVEAGTEYLAFKGVDELGNELLKSALKTGKLSKKIFKIIGGAGLKMTPQMGQEFAAGVLESVLDVAFLGEKSQYAKIHQQYIEAGMTDWEADYATFSDQFLLSPLYQATLAFGTGMGMATTSTITEIHAIKAQINATEAMLQNEQLSYQERAYLKDLKAGLSEEVKAKVELEQFQNNTANIIAKLSTINQNVKASPEITNAIVDFVVAMQDMENAIPSDVYDNVMAAYRTFEASGTNGNAVTLLNTAIQSIDIAIAQQQATGADTSALTALKAQLDSTLSGAGQGQTVGNIATNTVPDVGDLFVQYADTIGVDNMPPFSEFERMYNEGGAAWGELTLQVEYKQALRSGEITPFTSLDEYKAMVDGQGESGYNDSGNVRKFDYNKYLRNEIGDPPADMVDPHAHHILFKEGLGDAQKALVKEGQALLRRYGIDPIRGLENLVWAPNRIAGQHDIAALRNVVEQLKAVERYSGDYDDIVVKLRELGEIARKRRKD